ncbi:hypothetical protein JB92DRAFT_2825215 [Gautieria morchelliformis]|nr:hypothetical protein JB92DRAFT_2825215 [Gautieria morchelliformis]
MLPLQRFRHQPPNRTIKVQLLADVERLGRLGSIQSVAPGRMRSVLHPQRKAVYLLKNATPQLPSIVDQGPSVTLSSQGEVDFANLKRRLEALVPLVFHRSLTISAGSSKIPLPSVNAQAIHGSVTLEDIAQRLKDTYHLALVPPDAVLTFQEKNLRDKIRKTGSYVVLVHLRTGDIVSLTVLVEPEVAPKNQAQLPRSDGIAVEPISVVG